MCIKNKMTIRPFVLRFVLLISKKIRVEIMRRGGLIMNDILKRFCWLDDKMTAGIVRRSFFIVLALSRPSAIVLGIVAPLVFQHIFVRFADKISQSG